MPRCIGVMSGTSMDGVDAVLCNIDPDSGSTTVEAHARVAYAPQLRARLLGLQLDPGGGIDLRELAALDHAVGDTFSKAVLALTTQAGISREGIVVVGSHGQTIFHDPTTSRNSLQLGDPSLIAASCGIPVAADFRRADIAHGGQGAPLVPAFHRACFAAEAPCVILNLGGIANLTLLGTDGRTSGFDTGPASGLMDTWISRHQGLPFDGAGEWARAGAVLDELLNACVADSFFLKQPPKSTGRDYFNLAWLQARYARLGELAAVDVQRTLCELTAVTVAMSLQRHAPASSRLLLCGGGRHNVLLVERLSALLPGVRIEFTDAFGLDGDLVEAAAFAWLGWRRIAQLPGNIPEVTGADSQVVLGGLYLP